MVSASTTPPTTTMHGILQLPELLGTQRFPPISGDLVGRPGRTVVPVMTVLSMGNVLAAVISQAVHQGILRHLTRSPLHLLRPSFQDAGRRKAYARLVARVGKAGSLPAAEVPPALGGSADLPAGLILPVGALAYEPISAQRAAGLPPEAAVEVSTVFIEDSGSRLRRELEGARERSRLDGRARAVTAASVYIDDGGNFHYGPRGGRGSAARRALAREAPPHALGDAHSLLVLRATERAGVRQNLKKLRWTSRRPGRALGVDYAFTDERKGTMEFQVRPERRRETAANLLALSRSPEPSVDDQDLDAVLGNSAWEMLVDRPWLSIWRVAYRARHSPNKPVGRTLLTPGLREELWLAAVMSPCFVRRTLPVHDTLTVFDASGRNRHGNGGYGVAQRRGLTSRLATEFCTAVGTAAQDGALPVFDEPAPGVPPLARAAHPDHNVAASLCSAFLRCDWDHSRAPRGSKRRNPWRAVVQGEFKTPPRHVNVAEASAGALAATRSSAPPRAAGHVLVVGGDSKAALRALRKGRSSKRDINDACRRVAVRAFVRGVAFRWFYLPSKSNPADGPSRWWLDVKQARARFCSRKAWLAKFASRQRPPPRAPRASAH